MPNINNNVCSLGISNSNSNSNAKTTVQRQVRKILRKGATARSKSASRPSISK